METIETEVAPQIEVFLYVGGFACSTDRVTQMLGCVPMKTWRAGERTGNTLANHSQSGWAISSGRVTAHHLEPLVLQILKRFSWHGLEALRVDEPTLEVQVSCVVRVHFGTPALNLTAPTIGLLSSLRASVDIDLYVVDAET